VLWPNFLLKVFNTWVNVVDDAKQSAATIQTSISVTLIPVLLCVGNDITGTLEPGGFGK
jgi:hypothetical protein